MGRRPTTIEEIRQRVTENYAPCPITGCWWWLGAVNGAGGVGYGTIKIFGHPKMYAHRLAFEVAHGPIPRGRFVCHRCHNGHLGCVNPEHLYAGSALDNARDAKLSGRARKPTSQRGERHHSAKLTVDGASLIHEFAWCDGWKSEALGRLAGVSGRVVRKIVQTGRWGGVDLFTHQRSPED